MRTNVSKEIYNEKHGIKKQIKPEDSKRSGSHDKTYESKQQIKKSSGNLLADIQVYNPGPPAKKKQPPKIFHPTFLPNPYDPSSYAMFMQNRYGLHNPTNYYEYNINIDGVSGSHVKTSHILEDILPIKNIPMTYKTLSGRLHLYEFMRSTILPNGDGQDVSIENEKYNLLSQVKFMDINPYNSSRFSNNPYKGLSFGFLLYRACYPIRHNARSASTMCAKNSTGMNVRIYRLIEDAYNLHNTHTEETYLHDEWRDIFFYDYVKEQIIKQKVSPNFVIMYGYNVPINSGIDYDKMKMIYSQKGIFNKDADNIEQKLNMPKKYDANNFFNPNDKTCQKDKVYHTITKDGKSQTVKQYQGKAVVALTEAYNYSILGWTKKEYTQSSGNIKEMVNYGLKTAAVWESIIFQLLSALLVMQRNGIIINNFDMNRNVFIKDIASGGKSTNYWKYTIDGIEYYIPNHGYLLLIDTNFRDHDDNLKESDYLSKTRVRKIDGKFINPHITQEEIMKKTFDMLKKSINPDIFDEEFRKDGGTPPPEDIMRLLATIKTDIDSDTSSDISYYIKKYMKKFMNNRIGTPLDETEKLSINTGGIKEFRNGQMVVMKNKDGTDVFVLHVSTDGNLSRIVTRDSINPDRFNIIEEDVPKSSLQEYSVIAKINQRTIIGGINLADENLSETYFIK
jgi:hypothetical protein